MRNIALDNFFRKILFSVIGFSAMFFIVFSSIEHIISEKNIWIEAEDAEEITYPLQIVPMDGASGGKGIISTGSHGNSIGYATYTINIQVAGDYYFWGRCFWDQVCSNSFYIKIGDSQFIKFGEDPIMNKWHWIGVSKIHLNKGRNILYLWNAEEGSKIDRFMLTTDSYMIPTEEQGNVDMYIDFEDGCLPDVLDTDKKDFLELVKDAELDNTYLSLNSNDIDHDENTVFIDLEKPISSFIFRVCYKFVDNLNTTFSIYINYIDKENNSFVNISSDRVTLFKVSNGIVKFIGQNDSHSIISKSVFNDVAIRRESRSYLIKINGKDIFRFLDDDLKTKRLGFNLLNGKVCVDNISLMEKIEVRYAHNFHSTGFLTSAVRPESLGKYLFNMKAGHIYYQILKGEWMHTSKFYRIGTSKVDGFEALEGRSKVDDTASVVFGDDFWSNYSLKITAKANNDGDFGIFFNFQDSSNFYLFKWEKKNHIWKYVVLRRINGIESIICEIDAPNLLSGTGFWYKIEIRQDEGRFKIFIDDNPALNFNDYSITSGKIGLYTTCTDGAEFDDIQLEPIENIKEVEQKTYDYRFHPNDYISESYSNWIASSDSVIMSSNSDTNPQIFINKRIFEEVVIKNKKTFKTGVEISSLTSEIPKDIDVFYNFSSIGRVAKSDYQILIANNQASIIKDKIKLATVKFPELKRNSIIISYANNIWNLTIDNNRVIEYEDNLQMDSTNIAIGYSGIGEGKIYWDRIIIKDFIENIKELN